MIIGIDARCLEWQRGYVAGFTKKLINSLAKNKDYKTVLFFQNNVPDDIIKYKDDLKICILKAPKILLSKRIIAEQLVLPFFIKKEKCDYFFAPTYSAPLLIKCFLILCVWDITYTTNKKDYSFFMGWSLRIFSYLSSKKANKIITCSNFDANQIRKYYKVQKEKILVINFPPRNKLRPANDADMIKIKSLKKELGLPNKYILCLGVIYNRRNIDKIISGYIQSNLYQDKKIGICVIGRDATNPKINPKKLMEGLVSEGIGYYSDWAEEKHFMHLIQGAEFYICTSMIDGEGIILKEAAMCGVPVITSPMLKDAVNGNCVLINNPNSTSEWIETFNNLYGSNYEFMIDKSFNFVKKLSWDEVINKTVECLK